MLNGFDTKIDYKYVISNNIFFFHAGMAGLAVTYGLNLNARLSRWILSFCKLENKIISIERIYQYSQIPSEAPPVIENSRPPSTWPDSGTIELIDLKVCGFVSYYICSVSRMGIGSICWQ